jgi:biotin synthase
VVNSLKNKVIEGGLINREEAVALIEAPLEELCTAADEIRERFCSDSFDFCTIVNAKSGRCSENCKYCAQGLNSCAEISTYGLLDKETVLKEAKSNEVKGIKRFSMVTSGRSLSDNEVDKACDIVREIVEQTNLAVCISFGLLNEDQFKRLKDAGVGRVHNNLESSRRFFPSVCTTHTYDDKIAAINAAKRVGLSVCSGGIVGLGETMEDRIDMALEARSLGVDSIPVNMLNPIKGTAYEGTDVLTNDEMRRVCAIFRFINPTATIRMAGGRALLDDNGENCFKSGSNAAISGDMLTTAGSTIASDMALVDKLGYKVRLINN